MQTIKKNQQQYNVKKGCVRDLLLQFNIRYVINVSDNIWISICDNCKFMNRISLMLQLLLISDGNALLVNRFIGSNDCNGSQNQVCPIR